MQLMAANASGGLRSLICNRNGIVIAEAVYRCMICSDIFAELQEIHCHYQVEHIEEEILPKAVSPQANQLTQPAHQPTEVDFENDNFQLDPPLFNSLLLANSHFDEKVKKNNWQAESVINGAHNDETDSFLLFGNLENGVSLKSANGNPSNAVNGGSKGGYVTCEVCSLRKYYSHISRRYGVSSCESCAKFFYRYSQKPVKYSCPANNKCPLDIDLPGARCKSCLLNACFSKYKLDPKKHPKLFSCKTESYESEQVSVNAVNVSSDGASPFLLPNATKMKAKPSKLPSYKRSHSVLIKSDPSSPVHHFQEKATSLVDAKLELPSFSRVLLPSAKKSSKKRKPNELPLNSGNPHRASSSSCQCAGCLAPDCGTCTNCLAKSKKKTCQHKRCQQSLKLIAN